VFDLILRMWLKTSWQHYDSLIHSSEASAAGVQMISGYQFVNQPHPVNMYLNHFTLYI